MKLTINYGPDEIKALLREDLVRQGITAAADAPIELSDAGAMCTVEAERVGTLNSGEPPAVAAPPTPEPPAPPQPKAPPKPPLEVVEGGANPVDMSDVLGASAKIARNVEGKYPSSERTLMEGESHDFPGAPRR